MQTVLPETVPQQNRISNVEDDRRLSLQFIVYGSYYAVISLLFLVRGSYTACMSRRGVKNTESREQEAGVEVISAERF